MMGGMKVTESSCATQQPMDWRQKACHTIKEAAVILSTPPSQLRKLCRQGVLNPITGLGRKWRLATEDIEGILSRRLRKQIDTPIEG
jgi:helix-turn-helix protein